MINIKFLVRNEDSDLSSKFPCSFLFNFSICLFVFLLLLFSPILFDKWKWRLEKLMCVNMVVGEIDVWKIRLYFFVSIVGEINGPQRWGSVLFHCPLKDT